MDEATRQLVRTRAEQRCEYCRLPQSAYLPRFHVEHIRAESHGGCDDPDNLCLACPRCNRQKGPNLSAHDPVTDELVPLFNPRTDIWSDHFTYRDEWIDGRTKIGRATVHLLKMNEEQRRRVRWHLQQHGELE
jgi:5-methylcytosine-specific restriction endonuclease McrA